MVIGNPPYDRDQSQASSVASDTKLRFGGMIRHSETGGLGLVDDFITKTPPGMRDQLHGIYELATYFWRWAVWKVCEQPHPSGRVGGPGIVSFITPSAWVHSDPWAGMRHHLRARFDRIWVLDLGGNQRLASPDGENVFPIQTPVCVTVAVRSDDHSDTQVAAVYYQKIRGNTRIEKLKALGDVTLDGDDWEVALTSPLTAPFTPPGRDTAYAVLPAVDDVLPWKSPGVQYNRTWPIAITKSVLRQRWKRLISAPVTANATESGGRATLFKETRDRNLRKQPNRLDDGPPELAIKDLSADEPIPESVRYGHRPFCIRWAIADNRLGDMMRPKLWQGHSPQQAYLVTASKTDRAGDGPTAVIYADIPDKHSHHGHGGAIVFPLWHDKEATEANADHATIRRLSERYGQRVTGQEAWYYTAGLLGTEAYSQVFSDLMATTLKPRVPFPDTHHDFATLVTIGEQLVNIAKGTNLVDSGVRCATPVDPTRLPTFSDRCYQPDMQILRVGGGEFTGITANIWNHQVSGYRTLPRWIRARSVAPGGVKSSPLDCTRPDRWSFTQGLIEVCDKIVSLNQVAITARPILNRMAAALTN